MPDSPTPAGNGEGGAGHDVSPPLPVRVPREALAQLRQRTGFRGRASAPSLAAATLVPWLRTAPGRQDSES